MQTPPSSYPIQVLMSAAGYYIGQVDEDGLPYSRISGYFRSREEAEIALTEGFVLRDCMENQELYAHLREKGILQ